MSAIDTASVTAGWPTLWLARYDSERDNEAEILDATWPEWVEALSSHELTPCGADCKGKTCPYKKGKAISPAPPTKKTFVPERNEWLNIRGDKNVELVYALMFDFDGITWAELEGVCQRLEGIESMLYSTHSHLHDGPEDCRVRIVIPLWRPVTPAEFYVLHSEMRRRFGLQWWRPGAAKISGADPVVKDVSRLFFLPSAPEGTQPFWGYSPGAPLDTETLLREAPQAARTIFNAPTPQPSAPGPQPEAPIDMEALRQALRDYRPRNSDRDDGKIPRKELIRRVLAQEPLVKYEETGLRNDAVHRLGSILGHVLPMGVSEDAVLELVRASIQALPVYPNDDENDSVDKRFEAFALAFRRGVENSASKRAAFEAKQKAEKELRAKMKRRFRIKGSGEGGGSGGDGGGSGGGGGGAASPAADDEGDEVPDDWEELLLKNKKDEVWSVATNLELILNCHPTWRDMLSYNEFTKAPEFDPSCELYFKADAEEAITEVQLWFQSEYRINLSRIDVMTVIRHVAKQNSYNPIKDYLDDPTWDGVARIDTWLEVYCGAVVVDEDGKSIAEHVRRIARRWLMSAVARALEPGCKADTVLILEGEQGKKKSMVLETLAGLEWFTDSPVHIGQKDAMQIVGTKWIIEMAELSSFHGSETEQQKQFFSSRVDTFRPPFGLTPQAFPRHAVLAGTPTRPTISTTRRATGASGRCGARRSSSRLCGATETNSGRSGALLQGRARLRRMQAAQRLERGSTLRGAPLVVLTQARTSSLRRRTTSAFGSISLMGFSATSCRSRRKSGRRGSPCTRSAAC